MVVQVPGRVSKEEYRALASFRHGLRKFLRFSEEAAKEHGLRPQQHQLLLAIKGFPTREWATVNELSERLQLEPHSVGGIVDRCSQLGLVERKPHPEDLRVTEVHLTAGGEAVLERLTIAHRDELSRSAEFLDTMERIVADVAGSGANSRETS